MFFKNSGKKDENDFVLFILIHTIDRSTKEAKVMLKDPIISSSPYSSLDATSLIERRSSQIDQTLFQIQLRLTNMSYKIGDGRW